MGGLRRDTDALTLPHPRAAERAFVLVPWLELDAEAQLPGIGRDLDASRGPRSCVTLPCGGRFVKRTRPLVLVFYAIAAALVTWLLAVHAHAVRQRRASPPFTLSISAGPHRCRRA